MLTKWSRSEEEGGGCQLCERPLSYSNAITVDGRNCLHVGQAYNNLFMALRAKVLLVKLGIGWVCGGVDAVGVVASRKLIVSSSYGKSIASRIRRWMGVLVFRDRWHGGIAAILSCRGLMARVLLAKLGIGWRAGV